ncbi:MULTISPECIES: WXG100 family type VII secretion target [Brachybacterium]|uniref:WXG100 family type VII secretion target n=1 Tax=Brachybacterium TaxID=43668 RepID=UPI000F8EAEC7|nr:MULTISPECIES: WXG100 family type VII secretion target [Brachybacterium]
MRRNEHVGFYGMDTAETEAFGELLGTDRARISSRIDELAGVIAGLDGFWRGPDASAFSSTWESLRGGAITSALDRLETMRMELRDHIEEQDTASGDSESVPAGSGAGGEAAGDDSGGLPSFPGAFLPNDWEDALGQGIGALGTGLDALGERLPSYLYETRAADIFARGGEDALVPFLKNADMFRVAGEVAGPIGDVVGGVAAGWDRWEADASDPSLSDGERWGRALLDGGANMGGAMGGAAAGAAIGSVVPGVGTVIGGVVGGMIGGWAGGGLANWGVDALLD